MSDKTLDTWNILLVDDEPDVHDITRLALKRKQWRHRGFNITSAMSGVEARKILENQDPAHFHVSLIDVVMETDDAGLELCKHIRATCPSSLRIVLRTGQPGLAPEERVLNEYDIDYYLSKTEATPERLYSVARACLRSSQDISTLVAFGKQLQSFSRALQNVSSLDDLLVFMAEGLRFLELKHSAATLFVHDSDNRSAIAGLEQLDTKAMAQQVCAAITKAHEQNLTIGHIHPGEVLGLLPHSFLIPFQSQVEDQGSGRSGDAPTQAVNAGLYVQLNPTLISEKTVRDFWADAMLFIDNWKIAYSTLRLQERLARERMLREKMYYERLQSIATMVTGVAHELNTPLGVANSASDMIVNLAKSIFQNQPEKPETKEFMLDLASSTDLLGKNLQRAQTLVRSFKQLSASQLSDQRTEADLVGIVRDCVNIMTPETKKKKVVTDIQAPTDAVLMWNGYPGHLTQVLVNFIQNAMRYAYADKENGKIDIRISPSKGAAGQDMYRIEFQDYGNGVPADIYPHLFEPFVTSGRSKGGTGLGLAISHNIVVNLLKGTIACESVAGQGTKFIIDVPKVVSDEDKSRSPATGGFSQAARPKSAAVPA